MGFHPDETGHEKAVTATPPWPMSDDGARHRLEVWSLRSTDDDDHGDDDHTVLAGIFRREEAALQIAFSRHGGKVMGVARRVLGDAGLAQDTTQDVFIALWDHPERFDVSAGGSLAQFLCTVAHRRAVDAVRREVRRTRREERVHLRNAKRDFDNDFVDDLVETEKETAERRAVRLAVRALPDDERSVILLAYFGGFTYRQVAEILGIPEGTAKTRIRRALQTMTRELRAGVRAQDIA
jgi:RNA polymerase sigma-70 factor, ECF subfamily